MLPEELRAACGSNPLCWLGVPLKSHNGTIGVLVLKSYQGGVRYSEKDKELLQFVSTQIATAIERQQMQARLQHMAQYDQLTDLPNRGFLHDRLKTALARARREQGRLAVLYLDLDEFKQVNDSFGHAVGDLLVARDRTAPEAVRARIGHGRAHRRRRVRGAARMHPVARARRAGGGENPQRAAATGDHRWP